MAAESGAVWAVRSLLLNYQLCQNAVPEVERVCEDNVQGEVNAERRTFRPSAEIPGASSKSQHSQNQVRSRLSIS